MRARATAPDPATGELSRRAAWLAGGMIVLTAVFWAGHSVVARLVSTDIPTFSLVSLRWWLAFVVFAALTHRRLWSSRWMLLKHWRYVLLNAVVGPVTFPILLYNGLKTTTVTNTSIIQCLVPCIVPVLTWLLLREKMKRIQTLGLALSLIGVATIVTKGEPWRMFDVTFVIGDLIILAGFIVWSIYTVVIRLKPTELDPNALLGATMAIAAVTTLPLWIGEVGAGAYIPLTFDAFLAIGYIAVFPTLLAYYFYATAIQMVGPNKASLASHLTPPIGVLLGVVFLGETFGLYHAISFAVILAGMLMVIRGGRVSRTQAPS